MADAEIIPLSARLKRRREELGISQAQAARQLDVARTAYRLWEMEAAKPSPDRWRLIARWLGVSVSTMLLSENLISDEEARSAPTAVAELDRWDDARRVAEPQPPLEDFYDRSAAILGAGVGRGAVGSADAELLNRLLGRIQEHAPQTESPAWQRAQVRKDLTPDVRAPSAARTMLQVVASDVATMSLEDAKVVVSELVTSALMMAPDDHHSPVTLTIDVARDTLRVVVERTTSPAGVPPFTQATVALVDAMSSRWGVAKERDGRRVTWCEFDLPEPGEQHPSVDPG